MASASTSALLSPSPERLHTLGAHEHNFRTNRLLSCLTACLPGHPSTKAAVSTSSSFLPREEHALPPPSTSALFFARKKPRTVPDRVVLLTVMELLFRHRGPMLPCPQEGPEKPRLAERKHSASRGSSLGCLAPGLHLCLTPDACVAAAGVSVLSIPCPAPRGCGRTTTRGRQASSTSGSSQVLCIKVCSLITLSPPCPEKPRAL